MIAAHGVHLHLPRAGGHLAVLQGLDLTVARGERLCIMGESGVGKSTILRVLLGLVAPTQGTILLDDRDLRDWLQRDPLGLRRRVQPVFQSAAAALPPRQRVRDILLEPLQIHRLASGAAAQSAITEALDRVALPQDVLTRYPHQLSGGQQQRVALARALILRPAWLLADEPTSALDPSTSLEIAALLRRLSQDEGVGLLVVTHDPALPLHLDATVRRLRAGQLDPALDAAAWLAHDRDQWRALHVHAAPSKEPT